MEFLKKLGVSLLSIAIAFIPLWIFLGIRSAASPKGFWQNLALGGVALYFLGGIQFLLIIALLALLFFLWKE